MDYSGCEFFAYSLFVSSLHAVLPVHLALAAGVAKVYVPSIADIVCDNI